MILKCAATAHPMTVENAFCTAADEPKPLDFRPIEAHDFRYHRLRIDQAAGGTGSRSALRGKGAVVMTYTHQEEVHATRKWHSEDALPRPGFKSTSVYFEWLAQRETRDYDRRQRLLEVAGFYRSLAGIIPAMPLRNAERWPIASPIQSLADN